MSYLVIEDFKLGMDRRKARVAGIPGSLWEGINGHITRGGDFERRKKFVNRFGLPAGTFGLTQIKKQLYVFGSGTTPVGMPAGVTYQRLQHPGVQAFGQLTVTGGSASAGVNKLSTLTVNAIEILGAAVDWVTSNAATATAIAAQINTFVSTPEYTAVANGAVVTFYAAAGTGTTPNGFVIASTVGGTVTVTTTPTMTGGVNGSSYAVSGIIDVTAFNGKIYVVAEFDNGDIFHYYDGARVTTWDAVATSISSNDAIASALSDKIGLDPRYITSAVGPVITIIAATAGTGFSISQNTVNGGLVNDQTITLTSVQANVPAVAESRASFTIKILSGVEPSGANPLENAILSLRDNNGHVIISAGVPWAVSNGFTAQALMNAINSKGFTDESGGTPGYSATLIGDTVTLLAPAGMGTAANGLAIFTNVSGTFVWQSPTVAIGDTAGLEVNAGSLSGGVNAIAAVAQVATATIGGTFEVNDQFVLTVDTIAYKTTGLAAGMGITAMTYQGKVYSVVQSLLEFCKLNDPTTWGSGTGSGFINMANQNSENESLICIRQYQNRIAVFSRNNIQIWVIAVDPANNTFQQSVENTGARSARSVLQYGNIDVFYLNDQGERSLRARDSSNAPAVNDVGVSIDSFLQDYMKTLSGAQIARACSVIEPEAGRQWLALHNRIFVYSFFPGSKISAWTYYDLSDEIGNNDITEMVRAGNRLYIRASNTIYLYGGDSGNTYPDDDEIEATISIPYLSGSKPATVKGITSFDAGLTGVWDVKLLPLCYDDTIELDVGIFTQSTYTTNNKNPIQQPVPLFAVKMTCSTAGYASVSNMAVHFDVEDET